MVLVININFLNIKPFQACLTSCVNVLQISLNNAFPILVITKWQIWYKFAPCPKFLHLQEFSNLSQPRYY
jgi:hypothetical protein